MVSKVNFKTEVAAAAADKKPVAARPKRTPSPHPHLLDKVRRASALFTVGSPTQTLAPPPSLNVSPAAPPASPNPQHGVPVMVLDTLAVATATAK